MVAETRFGPVAGTEEGGVCVWRGIPFARAERFRPPEPPEIWVGARDATRFGPVGVQIPAPPLLAPLSEPPEHQSEDCLNLNVWSPAADGPRRPVMVWIHGGAFVWGSGQAPWYDGTALAGHGDLVVVTINYRLGPLGFFRDTNCGLLDQIAALRWVRENIAAFGGDPDRVTVAGESAGSISVGLLLGMPEARGLFQRAIMESGAPAPFRRAPEQAESQAAQVVAALGGVDPATVPPQQLLTAAGPRGVGPGWGPVGGSGEPSPVPLLIGTNRDEFMFYGSDPVWTAMDETALVRAAGPVTERQRAHYLSDDLFQGVMRLITDRLFWYPSVQLASTHSGPVWMYRLDWESPKLKACHALEVPFVFGNLDRLHGKLLAGDKPAVAEAMHRAWIAFIRDGDPGWPRYDRSRRATMLFDAASRVEPDPAGDARRVWEQG